MYLFHKATLQFELNWEGQLCAVIASSRNDVAQVLYKTCGKKSLWSLLCTKPGSCHCWMKHISNNSEEGMKECIGIFVCNITQLMKLQSQPQWNHCCPTWDLLQLLAWFMHLMTLHIHISFKDIQTLALSQLGLNMAEESQQYVPNFCWVPQTYCGISLRCVGTWQNFSSYNPFLDKQSHMKTAQEKPKRCS